LGKVINILSTSKVRRNIKMILYQSTPQCCYVADIPLIEPASSADLSQISADLNLGINSWNQWRPNPRIFRWI